MLHLLHNPCVQEMTTVDVEEMCCWSAADLVKRSSSSKDYVAVISTSGAESIAKVLFHLELFQQLSYTLNCPRPTMAVLLLELMLVVLRPLLRYCFIWSCSNIELHIELQPASTDEQANDGGAAAGDNVGDADPLLPKVLFHLELFQH